MDETFTWLTNFMKRAIGAFVAVRKKTKYFLDRHRKEDGDDFLLM